MMVLGLSTLAGLRPRSCAIPILSTMLMGKHSLAARGRLPGLEMSDLPGETVTILP